MCTAMLRWVFIIFYKGDLVLVGKYRIKPQYPHPHGPPWELALNAGTAYLFKLQGTSRAL